MNKKRILGILSLIIGTIILFNSFQGITGFSILKKTYTNINWFVSLLFFILGTLLLSSSRESLSELENIAQEKHWKKFDINKDSIIQDIEQGYLSNKKYNLTEIQEQIERNVTNGKIIKTPNQNKSYNDQFYEGHASQGGRVIDVASHIAQKGKNKGKLVHFEQPANARYLWVVDEDGNFIVANRKSFHHEMDQMNHEKIDLAHRIHKLSHSTLARGRKVYASGEVMIEGGKVKSYNAASGHYVNLKDIKEFNNQSEDVFRYFMEKVGWKEIYEKAKYEDPKR